MKKVPTLVSLCLDELKKEIALGDDIPLLQVVHDLPPELLDDLVLRLPPFALEKLHSQCTPLEEKSDSDFDDNCAWDRRKRRRFGRCHMYQDLNTAWMKWFKLRWPHLVDHIESTRWRQAYWERHLQNCLDGAAEVALIPSFDGYIGDIQVPDTILKCVGYEGNGNLVTGDFSTLSYHCLRFGYHARYIRLPNVLCNAETSNLLTNGRLQRLVLTWIKSKEQIDGLCKLLNQHSKTLTSLEFIHCKFSPDVFSMVCDSLVMKSTQTHGIQHFSFSSSSFLQSNPVSFPSGLVSFLSSGRSLHALKLSENRMGWKFANIVFMTLLSASSNISVLDLSENNIAGWLSAFNQKSSSSILPFCVIGKSLQSLHVLNLRGNNLGIDDTKSLKCALIHMPNLEVLDLSDNPIEDEGIGHLLPYFIGASERCSPLADLKLEYCEMTSVGAIQLLNILSTLKRPLKSLSVAHNFLGSPVARDLGKILGSSIEVLNIGGIGFGSSGFKELRVAIGKELKLVNIDISKNHGEIETARFLSTLLSRAPVLTEINAAYNRMPLEGLRIICSSLKVTEGKLERLDLTGNAWDPKQAPSSMLAELKQYEKTILILPSVSGISAPYDDDP